MKKDERFKSEKPKRGFASRVFDEQDVRAVARQTGSDRAVKKLLRRAVKSIAVPADLRDEILARIDFAAK